MRYMRSGLGATALVVALSAPVVAQDESDSMAPEVNPGDKIGISLIATTDTNTVNAMTAFKARAEADGWEIIEVDTQGAQDNANTAIESFVNQGVKGIMSTIYPPDALQAGITAANEAGIPVVGHFSGDGPGVAAFSSSGGDDQMTQMMVDTMGGTGQVLAFTYRPGKPCLEREDVFDAVMANYPDIEVTKQEGEFPEYVQSTADAARGWMISRPKGEDNYAIWACWEGFSLAAIPVMKESERDDVLNYGYNADFDGQAAVREGWLTATTWFDNLKAGNDEYDVLMEAIAAGDAWELNQEIPAETVVVTADNIDAWLAEHPEAAPPN